MNRDLLARSLLVVALLIAQSSALSHELWHLRSGDLQGASADTGKAAPSNPLCSQHQGLDAVLGALHGACALPIFVEDSARRDFPAPQLSESNASPSPSSRDPPARA